MNIYQRSFLVANGNPLYVPVGATRWLWPIGMPPTGRLLKVFVRQATTSIPSGGVITTLAATPADGSNVLTFSSGDYATLAAAGVAAGQTYTVVGDSMPTAGYILALSPSTNQIITSTNGSGTTAGTISTSGAFQAGTTLQDPSCGISALGGGFSATTYQGTVPYLVRVYDRDWRLAYAPATWTPTLTTTNTTTTWYAPGGAAVTQTIPSQAVTTDATAAFSLTAGQVTALGLPTTPAQTANVDIIWSSGGLNAVVPNQYGAPIYPGQQWVMLGATVTCVTATTFALTTLGNVFSQTAPFGVTWAGPTPGLPTTLTGANPESLMIRSIPPSGSGAFGESKMEVVCDENISSADITNHLGGYSGSSLVGWGSNSGSLASVTMSLGAPSYLTGSTGLSYRNREGTFAVPVRQLYLEIDLNSSTGWMTSGTQAVVGAAPATIEVEMSCEVGGEIS